MHLVVCRTPAASASTSQTNISFEVLAKLSAAPPAQKFSSCDLDCSDSFQPSNGILEMLLPLLSPGATLTLRVPSAAASDADTSLLFAGFVNARARASSSSDISEIDAQKPQYEAGAASLLPTARPAARAWTLSADDDAIDEDALLSLPDAAASAAVKIANDDCDLIAGVRKACANCSCGRAEADASSKPPPVAVDNSACGSCYLGDAFRCSGCRHFSRTET